MKKTTKGALAAAAAGTLLLGGAGTYAFWTSSATVNGGSISSGSLTLTDVTCPSGWTHTENSDPVSLIVPGDNITKHCSGTLTLVGEHIGATVGLTAASVSSLNGSLGSEVTADAVMTSPSATIDAPGVYPVGIDITVDFPDTVTSVSSQSSSAALNALTLTATQTHDAS
jgi:alternate signal-mediated exported protein